MLCRRRLKVGRLAQPSNKNLPGRMSSINNQGIPRHEAARITQHEQRRAPILFRPRQPSQHILPLPRLPQLRILPEILLHHRRHDMPGTQAIYPDALLPPLHGQVPTQLDNGCFRGVVHRRDQAFVGDEAAHAGDEHHRARAFVLPHPARDRRGGHEYARVVDFDHAVHVGDGVFGGRTYLLDAGRGDQAVEALVLGGDFERQGVDLVGVAYVAFCVGFGLSVALVRSSGAVMWVWMLDVLISSPGVYGLASLKAVQEKGKGKGKGEISRCTYACSGGNRRSRDLLRAGRPRIPHLGCPGGRGSRLGANHCVSS